MKKIVIATAILLSVQFTSAQSADFKKDAIEAVKLSGATANFSAYSEAVMSQIPDETKRAEFKKEFDATLPALYDKMADTFTKNYTHDDIKKMIEFYNSPVGKKIQQNASIILKEQGASMEEWGNKVQGIIRKYMQ